MARVRRLSRTAPDLELLAATLDSAADVDLDEVLQPEDIRAVCQLLLDVRRNPSAVTAEEAAVARRHFPEVEAETLAPLERLVTFYTSLLRSL